MKRKPYAARIEDAEAWCRKLRPIEELLDKMDERERRCTLLMLAHHYPHEYLWAGRQFRDLLETLDDPETNQRH
jgi:hypothetical protein